MQVAVWVIEGWKVDIEFGCAIFLLFYFKIDHLIWNINIGVLLQDKKAGVIYKTFFSVTKMSVFSIILTPSIYIWYYILILLL